MATAANASDHAMSGLATISARMAIPSVTRSRSESPSDALTPPARVGGVSARSATAAASSGFALRQKYEQRIRCHLLRLPCGVR